MTTRVQTAKLPAKLPANLASRIVFAEATACWEWTGSTTQGYGAIAWGEDGRSRRVHRVVYELLVGPVPPPLMLDHLCRNRRCVNPAHLEPVTNRENVLRGIGPTAVNAAKTHCSVGHEFTEVNTYYNPRDPGWRRCRACRRAERRAAYWRAVSLGRKPW